MMCRRDLRKLGERADPARLATRFLVLAEFQVNPRLAYCISDRIVLQTRCSLLLLVII